ncbi:MAG: ABC transporter substrate-binding protein [Desulfarculaceae bacterium]|nr:ABC transporter substrate-binding protein [Desulfarculaceae bacterium]MCF8047725.1 ABC transporter substrate-binding protein [Desulfarculaceae bacterium]MCF8096306.1 ABC transporter substrate-binding protein [Desulfarculaceae bacterium]
MAKHDDKPSVTKSVKSLNDPFDFGVSLKHHGQGSSAESRPVTGSEDMIDRAVENTVVKAIFKGNDVSRRRFMKAVGASAAMAIIGNFFPLDAAKAWAKDASGPLEKKALKIGFIPITCATPIIMADPMGFYAKHGLEGTRVVKAAGWAMIRDWAVSKQVDCAHMLSPMPLALTLGAGSPAVPFLMPAVENINGQAITLHKKYLGKVKSAKDMKGFTFCVPFDYSMHNFLLRYYLAEGGVDPDRDVKIRVVPPPEMVANLRAGNVDGYLAPDPFNQRAVYEDAGYIFMLTRDIWPGHPCCAFAASQEFATTMPNTFKAVFKSLVDATHYAHKAENRKEIAKAISPRNYLNQPKVVVEQVLTGNFPDGKGGDISAPDRIDFDPFPWDSMAVWILTQMKRWGYVKGDVDYNKVAEQVFLASDCRKIMKGEGYQAPAENYKKHVIMGKTFDPNQPEAYIKSFAIRRTS